MVEKPQLQNSAQRARQTTNQNLSEKKEEDDIIGMKK